MDLMKTYGILVLIVISSIAVFGFVTMNHSSGNMHGGCIATANGAVDCPGVFTKITDFIALHASAFKTFTSATFGSGLLATLLLIVMSMGFALFASALHIKQNSQKISPLTSFISFAPIQLALTRWISLHENSPSFS